VDNSLSSSFNLLFSVAWASNYEYFLPNDDNRAADGIRLRERFESETSIGLPFLNHCRMLEFLIALAIRLNEATYDHTNPDQVGHWFWVLIENVGIENNGEGYDISYTYEIERVFDRINRREYNRDGSGGGLFPIAHTNKDQRDIEIWYQMMNYLRENL